MRKSIFIIPVALAALLAADQLYFKQLRDKSNGGAVSEAFLRKGTLGKLLRQAGFLRVSPDTADFATNDMCAADDELKGFDYHNTFRMRFKVLTVSKEKIHVKLVLPQAKRYRRVEKEFLIKPGQHYYALNFVADKHRDIELTFKAQSATAITNILLSDVIIDGRYGRSHTLVSNGQALSGQFSQRVSLGVDAENADFTGVQLNETTRQVSYTVEKGMAANLFSGVFPGKKNHGFCYYSAQVNTEKPKVPTGATIPRIKLNVEHDYLYGEKGIINNKQGKGNAWEIPAQYSINNGQESDQSQVGLRFHGGKPGRKKNILSFRINARKRYGKSTIKAAPLFGTDRQKDLKGVVFKYTYQAYGQKREQYNPFSHALALDIADAVGALVPSHGLVDLTINEEHQGLFLAMEHLSDRTVRNWLGRDNFRTYTYKKHNPQKVQDTLFLLLAGITTAKGEDSFKALQRLFDINNVLNSIILSAYIADDDYCQGIEIIDNLEDLSNAHITSINWDLDHAFLLYTDGVYTMPAERRAFSLLTRSKSLCPRRWVYSHVYEQSAEFRQLFRQRLEHLIANELSPEGMDKLLDYYRDVNDEYYSGKYTTVISRLETFTQERPAVLLRKLKELEETTAQKAL